MKSGKTPCRFLRPLLLLSLLLFSSPALRTQEILPRWAARPKAEQILVHDGFTVSYNSVTKCPNWVCWDLSPEQASAQAVGRTDVFTTDPLVKGPQAEDADYARNPYGLDRGHMAPSADFRWSREANAQTFCLTNVCPQDRTLNGGLWLELEQRCRAWAKRYGATVHVVCGPLFHGAVRTIGKGRVAVPSAFFKAVLIEVKEQSYAIAFVMPNEPLDASGDIFSYTVGTGELSRLCGLVPFPGKKFADPGKGYPFDIPWKKK